MESQVYYAFAKQQGQAYITGVPIYLASLAVCPIGVQLKKFQTPKKRKNTLNLFSLFTSEAKGSNQFCKGRQLTNLAKGGNCTIGYFPPRIFDIFLFGIKIFLYEYLEY